MKFALAFLAAVQALTTRSHHYTPKSLVRQDETAPAPPDDVPPPAEVAADDATTEAAAGEAGGEGCVNDPSYTDSYGDGCEWYDNYPCGCGYYEVTDSELTSYDACCACQPVDCSDAVPLPASFEGGECIDNPDYADTYGDGCDWYTQYGSCGNYDENHCMSALESCCACIEDVLEEAVEDAVADVGGDATEEEIEEVIDEVLEEAENLEDIEEI